MEVRFVDASGAHPREPEDVVELFAHQDGFFWVDVPLWDGESEPLLLGLGCHPMVIEGCRQRNHVPTVHGYDDHVFVTTQCPFLGAVGHVHLLELDQIIAHHFLVTGHGPINPDVEQARAQVETDGVLARIEAGRFRPATPVELSYAITSAVARRQSGLVRDVALKLPGLEQQVMSSQLRAPEALLESLFLIKRIIELIKTIT